VDEQDLSITMENGVLTVRGERKLEEGEKEKNFLRMERPYGAFSRSFTLPQAVDTNHIDARYVNGVLTIELRKRAEAKPKQIPISTGQKALGRERLPRLLNLGTSRIEITSVTAWLPVSFGRLGGLLSLITGSGGLSSRKLKWGSPSYGCGNREQLHEEGGITETICTG
jgi:hypothetical protein